MSLSRWQKLSAPRIPNAVAGTARAGAAGDVVCTSIDRSVARDAARHTRWARFPGLAARLDVKAKNTATRALSGPCMAVVCAAESPVVRVAALPDAVPSR